MLKHNVYITCTFLVGIPYAAKNIVLAYNGRTSVRKEQVDTKNMRVIWRSMALAVFDIFNLFKVEPGIFDAGTGIFEPVGFVEFP